MSRRIQEIKQLELRVLLSLVHLALNDNHKPTNQNSKDEPEENCSVRNPVECGVDRQNNPENAQEKSRNRGSRLFFHQKPRNRIIVLFSITENIFYCKCFLENDF